jgi:hypothetical protein
MGSLRRIVQAALLVTATVALLAVVAARRSVEVWHVAPESTGGRDEGP